MNKIKTEIEWNINIQSQTNVPASVTKDDFLKALFSINRENNQKRINEFDQKMRDDHPDEISIWQTNKKEELQSKFINSLNIEFTDNQVNIVCDFNCNFPGDWNKVDVIEWSEGFDKLYVEYLMASMDDIIAGDIIDNKDLKETFIRITENQKFNITKLGNYVPVLEPGDFVITIKGKAETDYPIKCRLNGIGDETDFVGYMALDISSALKEGYMRFVYEDDELFTVNEYIATRELTEEEMKQLIDYTQGQWSDGIGESFEQRPIMISGDEVYISPWHSGQKVTYSQEKK
jgi:hypothetical protein